MSTAKGPMACSITNVILLQAGASMHCTGQRPHTTACLTYAGTSGTAHNVRCDISSDR